MICDSKIDPPLGGGDVAAMGAPQSTRHPTSPGVGKKKPGWNHKCGWVGPQTTSHPKVHPRMSFWEKCLCKDVICFRIVWLFPPAKVGNALFPSQVLQRHHPDGGLEHRVLQHVAPLGLPAEGRVGRHDRHRYPLASPFLVLTLTTCQMVQPGSGVQCC